MKTKRFVNEGRVNCPRRGDTDVEVCVLCPELIDVHDKGEAVVECRGRPRNTVDHLLVVRW